MLVIGTHGRKGLNRLVMGSVAEEVIRRSYIPVMTLGPYAQGKAAFGAFPRRWMDASAAHYRGSAF